jgi:hypothetical protein
MPSARTRARVAGESVALDVAPENDLEKPDRQLEVLSPKAIGYKLRFPREAVIDRIIDGKKTREPFIEIVERGIEIATEFTIGQMINRKVLDNLDAFVTVAIAELQRIAPADARTSNMQYVAAALTMGSTRMLLRELIASVAKYTDSEGERIVRPTVEEIENGMASSDLDAIGMFYLDRVLTKRAAEKKAIAEE